jgi:hypothetical protein
MLADAQGPARPLAIQVRFLVPFMLFPQPCLFICIDDESTTFTSTSCSLNAPTVQDIRILGALHLPGEERGCSSFEL